MKSLIPLEDSWTDVIRKARRGQEISEQELALRSNLPLESILDLERGHLSLENLERVGEALGLGGEQLLTLAQGKYHPGVLELPEGLAMFTTPWHDFEVHSYLLWDPGQPAVAAAFDTGSDATEMLDFLTKRELALRQIFLTHGHGDHVFELDRLMEKTGAVAWIGEGEEVPDAGSFVAGKDFFVGSLRIETRFTWGHAVGGISYVIHGLSRPVAMVGDALFAGSMGGPMVSYQACLETNRREIFSLPPEALVCPGHGPLTTVALEREHNPFFGNVPVN